MKIRAKRSLGQNFLIDKNIVKRIIQEGNIAENETILEVGPGTGNLTEEIIKQKPKKIILIEKDNKLAEELTVKFGNNVKIINDDILKIQENNLSLDPILVFGNLPYNISTKILTNWICNIKNKFWFKKLLLMFQKEVADRIIAETKTKNYGRLSVISQWKMNIRKITDINPSSFYPKPKILSTLLEFTPKKDFVHFNDIKNLEKITKTLFNKRRKMIKNSIFNLVNKENFSKINFNINLNSRPQDLKPEQYYNLTKEIEKIK